MLTLAKEKKVLFEDEKDLELREQLIKDNCFKVEREVPISVQLTKEERIELMEHQSNLAIQLYDLDQEKKEFNADWKERQKPIKESHDNLLDKLEHNRKVVEMNLFCLQNFDDETIEMYNEEGLLIASRPMTDAERQTTI